MHTSSVYNYETKIIITKNTACIENIFYVQLPEKSDNKKQIQLVSHTFNFSFITLKEEFLAKAKQFFLVLSHSQKQVKIQMNIF